MGIFDIYSKRKRKAEGNVPDVYQYDEIPREFRVQVVHMWRSAFGDENKYETPFPHNFEFIHDTLAREYGVFKLAGDRYSSFFERVCDFLLQEGDTDKVLDVVELSFKVIDILVRKNPYAYNATQEPDDVIQELNGRLREHGIGYQYESGIMIRVDSQLLHSEVVKPALSFLSDPDYKGANEEYLSAHNHYRSKKYKECLNDCLKAFESTMKSLCDKRGWQYGKNDTSKVLIGVLFNEGLIPSFMQSHFTGLRTSLESGVPTTRNKLGGHGQGSASVQVPESIASYLLHLTATNINLLVKLEQEMK